MAYFTAPETMTKRIRASTKQRVALNPKAWGRAIQAVRGKRFPLPHAVPWHQDIGLRPNTWAEEFQPKRPGEQLGQVEIYERASVLQARLLGLSYAISMIPDEEYSAARERAAGALARPPEKQVFLNRLADSFREGVITEPAGVRADVRTWMQWWGVAPNGTVEFYQRMLGKGDISRLDSVNTDLQTYLTWYSYLYRGLPMETQRKIAAERAAKERKFRELPVEDPRGRLPGAPLWVFGLPLVTIAAVGLGLVVLNRMLGKVGL